jgi:hypothetical protein
MALRFASSSLKIARWNPAYILDVPDTDVAAKRQCRLIECRQRGVVVGQRPGVRAEGQTREPGSEQAAAHQRERQHAADRAAAARDQVGRPMTPLRLEELAPRPPMEEARERVRSDVGLPRGAIGLRGGCDRNRWRDRGGVHVASRSA